MYCTVLVTWFWVVGSGLWDQGQFGSRGTRLEGLEDGGAFCFLVAQ